jgi:hypothetical protein
MKKLLFSLILCSILKLSDPSTGGVSAQSSVDEQAPATSSIPVSGKGLKVKEIMSDWTIDGSNIYVLSTYVGIGTSIPGYPLDILHSGSTGLRIKSSSGFSVIDLDAFNGDAAIRFGSNGANQWNLRNQPGTNNLEIFELGGGGSRFILQDATGFVGINDSSPTARLSVVGKIKMADGTQAFGRVLTSDANGTASWQPNPTSPFVVAGDNIYYPSGNIGINMSTPHGKLQFYNGYTNRVIVLFEEADNAHQFYGFGMNTGILRYQVGTGGNHVFYAGTNSTTSKELFRIAANGNVTAAGVISFTSDARLKRDIRPIGNVMPKLTALNGYTYYWKDKTNDNRKQMGLLAQEVEKIYPDLVETNESGYKSVNYISLIPVLIEGIKDLQHQLNNKNADINQLKLEIAAIKAHLGNLTVSTGVQSK